MPCWCSVAGWLPWELRREQRTAGALARRQTRRIERRETVRHRVGDALGVRSVAASAREHRVWRAVVSLKGARHVGEHDERHRVVLLFPRERRPVIGARARVGAGVSVGIDRNGLQAQLLFVDCILCIYVFNSCRRLNAGVRAGMMELARVACLEMDTVRDTGLVQGCRPSNRTG